MTSTLGGNLYDPNGSFELQEEITRRLLEPLEQVFDTLTGNNDEDDYDDDNDDDANCGEEANTGDDVDDEKDNAGDV